MQAFTFASDESQAKCAQAAKNHVLDWYSGILAAIWEDSQRRRVEEAWYTSFVPNHLHDECEQAAGSVSAHLGQVRTF
jgi:hypothetical protein